MTDIHGGNIREVSECLGKSEEDFIDFSANINPLGFPSNLVNIILKHINSIEHYPDIAYKRLSHAIAAYHHLSPESIIVGNGSTEIFHLLPSALRIEKALIPIPTFSEYENACKNTCIPIEHFPMSEEEGFQLHLKMLQSRIESTPEINALFLCNPNNPTGVLLDRKTIDTILNISKSHQLYVIIDEAFIEFYTDYRQYESWPLLSHFKNLIIVRSLTKFYGLPGLRCGYAIASPQVIARLKSLQYPWSINCMTDILGQHFLQDLAINTSYQEKTRKMVKNEIQYLTAHLSQLGFLKVFPPSVNFILCKITLPNITSFALRDMLASQGILIRDCSTMPGLSNKFIRVAVRSRTENKKLLGAMRHVYTHIINQ